MGSKFEMEMILARTVEGASVRSAIASGISVVSARSTFARSTSSPQTPAFAINQCTQQSTKPSDKSRNFTTSPSSLCRSHIVANMDSATQSPITVIVNSVKGHDIAFAAPKDTPLSSIYDTLYERAPWIQNSTYILTTNSRRAVSHDDSPVSSLLSSPSDTFLSLRLTVPLCGGKGGFGSILRAQGGRMSSRKKKDGDANASSRNLDGRRLRTVAEAKVLAEYLAIKPEMEQREKEDRRKRWEDIVASTERKTDELMTSRGTARLDGKWVEDKEEAENKTREAIEKMLMAQRESSEEDEEEDSKPSTSSSKPAQQRQMFGWDDEDDEFMSDSEEEEDVSEGDAKPPVFEGKGKAAAA
jgi:hypothetical protein